MILKEMADAYLQSFARRAWPNQTEVTVKARHFLQADSPEEIGQALTDLVRRVRPGGDIIFPVPWAYDANSSAA